MAAVTVGTSSRAALMNVQLPPPSLATAAVYGSRTPAPNAVGSAISRNFCAAAIFGSGLMP